MHGMSHVGMWIVRDSRQAVETMATEKTWAQLEADLDDTFRKWSGVTAYTLEWPYGQTFGRLAADRRRATRFKTLATDDIEQRKVTLTFDIWADRQRRTVTLTTFRGERPIDNLRLLAQAAEWMRMASVRDITSMVVRFYRQMYPVQQQSQQQTPPPREEPRVSSAGPYAVLHVANDAPLEVAEAAYRALVKKIHPDVAGNGGHAQMVALNAAIEQIRQRVRR